MDAVALLYGIHPADPAVIDPFYEQQLGDIFCFDVYKQLLVVPQTRKEQATEATRDAFSASSCYLRTHIGNIDDLLVGVWALVDDGSTVCPDDEGVEEQKGGEQPDSPEVQFLGVEQGRADDDLNTNCAVATLKERFEGMAAAEGDEEDAFKIPERIDFLEANMVGHQGQLALVNKGMEQLVAMMEKQSKDYGQLMGVVDGLVRKSSDMATEIQGISSSRALSTGRAPSFAQRMSRPSRDSFGLDPFARPPPRAPPTRAPTAVPSSRATAPSSVSGVMAPPPPRLDTPRPPRRADDLASAAPPPPRRPSGGSRALSNQTSLNTGEIYRLVDELASTNVFLDHQTAEQVLNEAKWDFDEACLQMIDKCQSEASQNFASAVDAFDEKVGCATEKKKAQLRQLMGDATSNSLLSALQAGEQKRMKTHLTRKRDAEALAALAEEEEKKKKEDDEASDVEDEGLLPPGARRRTARASAPSKPRKLRSRPAGPAAGSRSSRADPSKAAGPPIPQQRETLRHAPGKRVAGTFKYRKN